MQEPPQDPIQDPVQDPVQDPAAADNIFLLTLGMEIMKYTIENIFDLSYYEVNNNNIT